MNERVGEPTGFDPSREHVPWLHVRGQFTYHGEAYIVGTRAGLLKLRNAIDEAIESRDSEAIVCANDGEGYAVTVRRAASCGQMGRVPYIDELAREMADFERQWAAKMQRHNFDIYSKIVAARDSGSKPLAAETAQTGSVHESHGAPKSAIAQSSPESSQ